MKHEVSSEQRKGLGFLLTLALIYLLFYLIRYGLGVATTVYLLPSLLSDVKAGTLPVGNLVSALASFLVPTALSGLTIALLFLRNKFFYLTFALCQISEVIILFFLQQADLPALAAMIFALLFAAGCWTLLFVSDRARTRFGLPVLCSKKPSSDA